ncbi:MAG: preprotein translocase subunit SecY [Lachnospiraceae bacterium]|nr:preprotein translocase subunit SecY [Lachnospiraceae bacterium]
MFKTFRNALKIKDVRSKLLFTFLCLIIVRIGCQLPVPEVDREYFQYWISLQTGFGFLDTLTGGSFSQMSIFALNISPYITSSIIVQLLTIAIPKWEEMQKDGETGRKKLAEWTRYITIGLAVFESVMMTIGFNNSGLLEEGNLFLQILVITASFTAGSAFLMWLGEQITEKGIGNGISVILLINIVAGLPSDFTGLYRQFIAGADNVVKAVIAAVIIIVVVLALVVLVVLLQDAQRKISVQYAKKMQGRKMVGGQSSHIPLKVNTAGVIPVIFASSLMQTPIIVSSLFGVYGKRGTAWEKVLYLLDQRNWCDFSSFGEFKYTLGLLLYLALLIFFAYFYTSVTFNPMEVANNLKKQGGFIPGIRPGRPTTEYLSKVLNYIILIGAVALAVISIIPIFFTGCFNAQVSFGGTSIIIIVGVVLEIIRQVETMMRERHYKGFLSNE